MANFALIACTETEKFVKYGGIEIWIFFYSLQGSWYFACRKNGNYCSSPVENWKILSTAAICWRWIWIPYMVSASSLFKLSILKKSWLDKICTHLLRKNRTKIVSIVGKTFDNVRIKTNNACRNDYLLKVMLVLLVCTTVTLISSRDQTFVLVFKHWLFSCLPLLVISGSHVFGPSA